MTGPVRAWIFDGVTASRTDVEVEVRDGLIVVGGERLTPSAFVRLGDERRFVYGLRGRSGWRLGFSDPPPAELVALLPKAARYGRIIDRTGLAGAAIGFGLISALVVTAVLTAPRWIAPLIPYSWEQRFGRAMIGDLGGRFCDGPGGQAALDKLVRAIDPGGEAVDVRAAPVGMVNAVALPGGIVLIFDGMLREAKSPEELAGVLGHELGHVRNRDVMQALVRQLGLSVLLGGLDSGVGSNLNVLLSARYSREAESAADGYAIAAMRRASISPRDTAAFFARLAKAEDVLGGAGEAMAYLGSHPAPRARQQRFAESAVPGARVRTILTDGEWRALTGICRSDPDRAKDDAWKWGF